MGQMSGPRSLSDIVENMSEQSHRIYHLGSANLSRSDLSRINNDKPFELCEALFAKLLARCQNVSPSHDFRFKNSLYSLDVTTLIFFTVLPWPEFKKTKGAVKLHVGLNQVG